MSIVWVFIILSAWDVRQVIFLGDYFNKLIVGDYWILSNYTSWIPISVEVSEGNLFPVHSFSGGTESSVRFFPYISLWLSGFLIYIFGMLWLGGLIGWDKPIFELGAQPFLLAELFKILIATFAINKIKKIFS